jgi:hypothetical protein
VGLHQRVLHCVLGVTGVACGCCDPTSDRKMRRDQLGKRVGVARCRSLDQPFVCAQTGLHEP